MASFRKKVCERNKQYSKKNKKVQRKRLPRSSSENCENKFKKKRGSGVFARHTKNYSRKLKVAMRGAVGSMTRFHSVCEEVEQWQAFTNGLFLLPRYGSVFCTKVGMPCRAAGEKFLENSFLQTR